MDMQRITNSSSIFYEKSKALYYSAFPGNERMDLQEFLEESQTAREIYAFSENGLFIGFAVLMNALDISHIIYFAVPENLQGRGTGSRILEKIHAEKTGRRIIVDIEAVRPEKKDSEERKKRRDFYLKNGFERTEITYNWQAEDYEILVRGGGLKPQDFHAFWKELFHHRKFVRVAAALIRSEDKIFATQRGYGEYKDWWEFPGGKLEPGETAKEALAREIREELDSEIAVGEWLTTVEHDYPDFHLSMDCFWCALKTGKLNLLEHEDARWLTAEELDSVRWLPADADVLELVKESLRKPLHNAPAS